MLRVWRAVLVIEYGKRASAGSRTRLERAKDCNIKMERFLLCRFLVKCNDRIDQEPRPAQRWRARGGRYEVARVDPKGGLASANSGCTRGSKNATTFARQDS